jgi:hypothetical protein
MYFRLDAAGVRAWQALSRCPDVNSAARALVGGGESLVEATADLQLVLRTLQARAIGAEPTRLRPRRSVRAWRRVPRWLFARRKRAVQACGRLLREPARAGALVLVAFRLLRLERDLKRVGVQETARRWAVPLARGEIATGPETHNLSDLPAQRRRIVWAVDAVLRHWWRDRYCLRRALLLGAVFADEQPRLRLGVSSSGKSLAHAWLETSVRTIGREAAYVPVARRSP